MSCVNLSEYAGLKLVAGAVALDTLALPPFSDEACAFLEGLSQSLLKDKRARSFPDVISFAYWCRKANIAREKSQRAGMLDGRLGRGVALHIAPGNVPVNFAFSYVFSILAGNPTIVRIPTKPFGQVDIILDAVRDQLTSFEAIGRRTAFVSYPSRSDITERLSLVADVRVIWGGDATVRTVRALPAKPRCIDISFSDRYSIAVLNADAVTSLDEAKLNNLAHQFYNDTYLMDQNACSSPQTIVWVGDSSACSDAQRVFWNAVKDEAENKYWLQAAVSVDKRVQLMREIASSTVENYQVYSGYLTTARIASADELSTELRGVGGFFHELCVDDEEQIVDKLDSKYQTIVQYGIDSQRLRDLLVQHGCAGVDRIVPIGQAMDIGLLWDGYDLIEALSRAIVAI